MDGLGDNLKKLLLAGIGAVAVTAEKSKDVLEELDELLEKMTPEQIQSLKTRLDALHEEKEANKTEAEE